PPDNKFCQRCGEALSRDLFKEASSSQAVAAEPVASGKLPGEPSGIQQGDGFGEEEASANPFSNQPLQALLMPPGKLTLSPATFLDGNQRYQVLTVLAPGVALVTDTLPEVRSPLQKKLPELTQLPASTLQTHLDLPPAAYPHLLIAEAAPMLYDTWQQGEATVLITLAEQPSLTSLIGAFSEAIDPLRYVYWMYTLTDLWTALAPISQWRSSLLLANNLGIDSDQSVRVRQFIAPAQNPADRLPELADLKAFLQSLLAQPHQGKTTPLRQINQTIQAVSSAETLEQLRSELAAIGESLLATPAAITPSVTAVNTEVSGGIVEGNLKTIPSTPSQEPVDTSSDQSLTVPAGDLPVGDLPAGDLPPEDLPEEPPADPQDELLLDSSLGGLDLDLLD
ncbi:MAG: hypothetical protein AAFP03_19130, partial [Cyanobacteria bacterium J06598_3]